MATIKSLLIECDKKLDRLLKRTGAMLGPDEDESEPKHPGKKRKLERTGTSLHNFSANKNVLYSREYEYMCAGDEPDEMIPYEYALARHTDRCLSSVGAWFVEHRDELSKVKDFEHIRRMLQAAECQANALDCYLRDIHYGYRDPYQCTVNCHNR